MRTVTFCGLLTPILLAACNGTVIMTPMSSAQIESDYAAGKDINGIIVTRATQRVEVDQFTQINIPINPKMAPSAGNTTLSNDCAPVETRKIVTVADNDHPYRLHYDHGILETYTFGATLSADGILLSINSQSTPDQGKTISNLASAASSAAGIKSFNNAAGRPTCTITPSFVRYDPA